MLNNRSRPVKEGRNRERPANATLMLVAAPRMFGAGAGADADVVVEAEVGWVLVCR